MIWSIYFIGLLGLVYTLTLTFKNSKTLFLIFIFSIILVTPAQVEIGSESYAPAFFTFLFNVLLERDYSFRVLRPLILSIPISLVVLYLILSIKRKFF